MLKKFAARLAEYYHRTSIRSIIFISFSLIALMSLVFTGVVLYARFDNQLENNRHSESRILVEQANQSVGLTISDMIRLSNTLSYQVIKNNDVRSENVQRQLQLLYDANSSYVESISLFSSGGELLATAPPALLKDGVKAQSAEWFTRAVERPEDVHILPPAVQNLFIETDEKYSWTISLSCAAEITQDKSVEQGVVLIDLKYSAISQVFKKVALANGGYVYLMDGSGGLIYHPSQQMIATGIVSDGDLRLDGLRDGEYTRTINGSECSVIVQSVGYTGWKVIGVIPKKGLTLDSSQNVKFLLVIILLFFTLTVFLNAALSSRLTDPLEKLDSSVRGVERDPETTEIYVGGSSEIQNLGHSIQRMVDIRRQLTEELVQEQKLKQKSERNALQSQINPHFLYNTLDIIVWAIEKGEQNDAVRIVSALGRFFRISLSRGKNIITVRDEVEHVRNYLMIQQARYKSKFEYSIETDEDTLDLSTIKLVLQPIVENAIYHSMEYMCDGEGQIDVRTYIKDDCLWLSVEDNGLGMTEETVARLLSEDVVTPRSKGSGIGLKNVNERIALYFGKQYGVQIKSEPDVGTTVLLKLPVIPYSEERDNT